MTIALRPYLASDAPILGAIYAAAIDELTAEDYTDEQRYAWIALAEDEQTFGQKLAASLTLVAIVEGEPVGFISLRDNLSIEHLYVSPNIIREGVATALCDALEKIATARKSSRWIPAIRPNLSSNSAAMFCRAAIRVSSMSNGLPI